MRNELYQQIASASVNCADIDDQWDAVIVGAGPAGSTCAGLLASQGAKVLLVEKSTFPRHKVCGSCLSGRAMSALKSLGLGHLPDELGAVPLNQLSISSQQHNLCFPLRQARSLSRKTLDAALVHFAIESGATFISQTMATIPPASLDQAIIHLNDKLTQRSVQARIAVAADGIGGTSLHGRDDLECLVARNSRIGVGAIVPGVPSAFEPGTIYMAYGSGGYVGLVLLENGEADIAAAFDADFLKEAGDPAKAVAITMKQARFPPPADLEHISWKGTVALTRRRKKLAARRLFVIGDAANYIEPFTGEGIAWALNSAQAVTPLVLAAIHKWRPSLGSRWQKEHANIIGSQQQGTKIVANLLRHNHLAQIIGELLTRVPVAIIPIARAISEPPPLEDSKWLRS